ncbi:MAG: hypothetical protein RRA92_06885 [Gemmatimonadota bacterium]|nr:hypothetical protein [Gemmatimonadota bacterium]
MRGRLAGLAAAVAIAALLPGPASAGPRQQSAGVPSFVVRALEPFRVPPYGEKALRLIARWDAEGTLRTARDSLLAARVLVRGSRFDEALSWLPAPAPGAKGARGLDLLLRLERARILLAREGGRRAEPGAPPAPPWTLPGARDFLVACEAAAGETARELWIDLRALFTPDEADAWQEATSPAGRCEVARGALDERAIRSATTPDERLAMHYHRLGEARERYWISRPRWFKTASVWRGRPDSLEVDDRGLLWIRLGEPDDVVFTTREPADDRPGIGEDWVYERAEGTWLFHLEPCDLKEGEPCFPRSGYRLVESFGPLAAPGSDFHQRYVTRLALDPLPLRQLAFARGAADTLDAMFNALETRARLRQAQMLARELHERAITEVPDVPDLRPDVDLAFQALRFWNPAEGRATVWFVATARAGDLEAEPDRTESGEERAVAVRLALGGPDGPVLRSSARRIAADRPLPEAAGLDVRLAATLAPGRVPFTFALRDAHAGAPAGNWVQDTLDVPDHGGPESRPLPALSDLAVAPDSGGSWTRDGRVYLPVSAAHVTGPGGALHVYFEAYGIRTGGDYEVEVRLVPADEADRIWRLDREALAYRVEFESRMPEGGDRIGTHHLRLDLGGTPPGVYLLGVRITDALTRRPSLPAVTPITVRERD